TQLSRRALIIATGSTGVSTLAGCSANEGSPESDKPGPSSQSSIATHASPDLEKWIEEVPRPDVIEPTGTKDGQPYYEVEIHEVEQEIHRDLPPTAVWGYDGQFPGPTIEAQQGEPIYVRWKNKLPDDH